MLGGFNGRFIVLFFKNSVIMVAYPLIAEGLHPLHHGLPSITGRTIFRCGNDYLLSITLTS